MEKYLEGLRPKNRGWFSEGRGDHNRVMVRITATSAMFWFFIFKETVLCIIWVIFKRMCSSKEVLLSLYISLYSIHYFIFSFIDVYEASADNRVKDEMSKYKLKRNKIHI